MKRKILLLLFIVAINSLNLSAQVSKSKLDRIINYEERLQKRTGKLDTIMMPEMAIKGPFVVIIGNKIYNGNDPYLKGPVKDSILFVKDIYDPNSRLEFNRILIFIKKR